MLPTSLFILHVEPADGGSSRKILTHSYLVGSLGRLPTDVHACDTIRISIESALSASEVSPVSPVAATHIAASWACLARVSCGDFRDGYSELDGFVVECVTEETVRYPIYLSSTLAAQLSFLQSEVVETLDSDACIMLASEIGQLFGEEPNVGADVITLSSTESPELQSCFAAMSFLVTVFLQYGSAILVSNLPQRDSASKVKLLQNRTALFVHHGYSNAVAVLVYANHILRDSRGWRSLL